MAGDPVVTPSRGNRTFRVKSIDGHRLLSLPSKSPPHYAAISNQTTGDRCGQTSSDVLCPWSPFNQERKNPNESQSRIYFVGSD